MFGDGWVKFRLCSGKVRLRLEKVKLCLEIVE